jgi:hypothetical protein
MSSKENAEQKSTARERVNPVTSALDSELEAELMLKGLNGNVTATDLPDHVTARPFRQAAVLREQKRRGNAFVQRMISGREVSHSKSPAQIQRHPPGAGITTDTGAAASQVQNPRPARPSDGHVTQESSEAAPSSATAGGDTAPSSTASPQAPETTGATQAPPSQGTVLAAAEGPTAPAPATTLAMDSPTAQRILTENFGSVTTIVPVTTILLDDNAATWTRYDEVNRGRTNPFVTPNRPWRDGDAQAAYPAGLNGFADGGTIYVNKQTTSPTTTCHEMLHSNTAADFRGKVGEAINEGATQYLTIKALTAEGIALPASIPYATQVGIVRKLVDVVGEGILISAYFGGADPLIAAFNSLQGASMFTVLKIFLDAQEWSTAEIFLTPPSTQQRIRAINALLDFWVGDADLDQIESIVSAAGDSDLAAIREGVKPNITTIMSVGQRMRLWMILGGYS